MGHEGGIYRSIAAAITAADKKKPPSRRESGLEQSDDM
jgi:hypothetical protein